MAGKENSDLFSQLSSNDGSLPLDFDKNNGAADPSKGETEKKKETSESNSIKSHPIEEKSETQRRPTHHIPPMYKKTVQETVQPEPKGNVETKSNIVVQDKPIEKTETESVENKVESKPAAVAVPEVQTSVSVSPAPTLAVASAPVVPASAQVVQAPITTVAVQVEKSQEAEPAPKRARHPKESHTEIPPAAEKQIEPTIQPKTDQKPQVPDIKAHEIKSSNVQKHADQVNVKKEVNAMTSPVSHDRKVSAEQKISKTESQKPLKKTNPIEKFSTDNATMGQLLQEGRISAGLGIEQVSTSTKIKKAFIESLERDDFENLPASVYVNAYIRVLCSLYNIDDKLVFSLVNKVKGKNIDYTVPEEVIQQLEKGKQVNIVQENIVKRMVFIGVAACFILVACILIGYYLLHMRGNPSSSTAGMKPAVKPVLNPELPLQTGVPAGISAKTLEEEMEKKLIAPHVFTMTPLPLAER